MTPTYDPQKYSVQKLPNLLLLHWILNPGLAINEILFGQRIPKVTLIDKTSSGPLMHRQYVPCPHCGTLHPGMLWSGSNGFGHWFGLICPHCRGKIPCLWNLASLLILLVTFPIWLPIKKVFEERYLEHELSRLEKMKPMIGAVSEAKSKNWIWIGFVFGSLIFATSLFQMETITKQKLLLNGASSLIAGILFGGFLWFVVGRKKSNRNL